MDYSIGRNKNRNSPPSTSVQSMALAIMAGSASSNNNNNNNSTMNNNMNSSTNCNPMYKDEREGCRSLVCDANGIIIAEMVYRCMICSNVTESIGDARIHYHQAHIDNDLDMNGTCGSTGNASDEPLLFPEDEDCYDDEEEEEEETFSYGVQSGRASGRAPFNTPSNRQHAPSSQTRTGHPGVQRSAQPAHTATSTTTFHHSNQRAPSAHYNHFNLDHITGHSSPSVDTKPFNQVAIPHSSGSSGGRKKISGKPVPPEKANSIKIQTSGTNGTCTIKSGYITCPVCCCTKFYTTLQRRYGQFSCVGCYRFFKEFFVKPKRFGCPQLGLCPLDQRTKCKACWMKKCIEVYTVDDTRRELLIAHRPLKRANAIMPPKSPTRPSNGGVGELALVPVSHRLAIMPPGGINNNNGSPPPQSLLETVLNDSGEDRDIDNGSIGACLGQNNNLSSSDVDDNFQHPPMKLPKLTPQPTPTRISVDDGQDEAIEEGEDDGHENTTGQFEAEEETGQDMAMQESGHGHHSLEIDQEEGNSLDDAEELPLDDHGEMMMDGDGSIDEGSSILLPAASSFNDGSSFDAGNRSPSKVAISRAAAIVAVSAGSQGSGRSPPRRKTSGRIKNWCCLKCTNCLADDCGKCINCLDRPKFGGPFIRKQRCLYKKCLMKAKIAPNLSA